MALVYLCLIAIGLIIAGAATVSAVRPLHLMQLESYQLDGYGRALRRNKACGREGMGISLAMAGVTIASLLLFALAGFAMSMIAPPSGLAALLPALATGILQAALVVALARWLRVRRRDKKPIVYTARMKRLVAILALLNAVPCVALCLMPTICMLLCCLLPALQPLAVGLAARLAQPIEKRINLGFFRDAQRILAKREDLIRVGITGSYGKTSTKFILAAILGERYSVLASPASYNTPMGLTRVVREMLKPEHQVFIAEMGARHVGDIRELCDLVHPSVGVLTSIGPQHLETFFTEQNVASTKFELIDSLPSKGQAIIAGAVAQDWPDLTEKRSDIRRLTAGTGPDCDVYAHNITVGPEGSSFTLELPGGASAEVHTKLLGAHNIDNITLCCAVAHGLGLSAQEIASGVSKAEPVEHRLQLIRGAGGNVVIDDAFNSNPAGAQAALDVLRAFPGRRIIVTPGMVELGQREQELNRLFGAGIASAADVAILVGGERTRPISQGLEAAGFAQSGLYVVDSLEEATQVLARIARPGDVTLFENDLPDNY